LATVGKSASFSLQKKLNERVPNIDEEVMAELNDLECGIEDLLTAQGLDLNFNRLPSLKHMGTSDVISLDMQPDKRNKWQREREKQQYYLNIKKQMDKLYNSSAKYSNRGGVSSVYELSQSNLTIRKKRVDEH